MTSTLDLKHITIQVAKKLLKDGMTAQDLLVSVAKMSTNEYSYKTKKFEQNTILVTKQSKLVQFCINNGASLKGAFKYVHQISASFIENNLPLLIANKYYSDDFLEHISLNPDQFNDPSSLITKLINDYGANTQSLSYNSFEPDMSFIGFLLSKGMKGNQLLTSAFVIQDIEKQKKLFDLAFKHGATSSSFKDSSIKVKDCNEDIFKILINDYKVSVQDLLTAVLNANIEQYNKQTDTLEPSIQLIGKQSELVDFLIENGASLKGIYDIPSHIVKSHLKQIINDKVDVKSLDLSDLTIEEIKTLLAYSSPEDLLFSVTKITTTNLSSDTGKYALNPKLIAKQAELIQFCIDKNPEAKSELQKINNLPARNIESYAINMLWINSSKNAEQHYLHPSKTLEELNTKLLMPAIKWAKANPTADVNIWYDSSLYQSQTVLNTEKALKQLASKEGVQTLNCKTLEKYQWYKIIQIYLPTGCHYIFVLTCSR